MAYTCGYSDTMNRAAKASPLKATDPDEKKRLKELQARLERMEAQYKKDSTTGPNKRFNTKNPDGSQKMYEEDGMMIPSDAYESPSEYKAGLLEDKGVIKSIREDIRSIKRKLRKK